MREYPVTKVAYREPGGTDTLITSETAFNKKLKDATDAKEPLPEQVVAQSFTFKHAESVDEAVALAGGSGVGVGNRTGLWR